MAQQRPTWHETDVDASGVRLRVRRLEAGGPPLVLLHGLGVGGAVWQSLARRLAPAWSAVAPDLRGHGASAHPAGGYEPANYAADVAHLIDALGLGRVPVVGHSLGALVALALAVAAPDQVAALALLDPPLDATRSHTDVERIYELRHGPPGELEAFLADDGAGARAQARPLAALFGRAADAAFEAHLAAERGAPWEWAAASTIAAPTLAIQADLAAGGVLGDHAAADFVRRLPRGTLLKIPGAPHAVHASHAAQVAAALLDFLAQVRAPR